MSASCLLSFHFPGVEIFHLPEFYFTYSKHLSLYCTATSTLRLTQSAVGIRTVLHKFMLHLLENKCKRLHQPGTLNWWDHQIYLIMYFYKCAMIHNNKILHIHLFLERWFTAWNVCFVACFVFFLLCTLLVFTVFLI